jgi:hypothetical protein
VKLTSPKLRRVIPSAAIGLGLALAGVGVAASVTGSEEQDLPPQIEDISPVRNATQVLSQAQIFVDLADGYTGVLTVNGVEIPTYDPNSQNRPLPKPGQQITLPPETIFEPGNYTLTFSPTDDALVTELRTGVNVVSVRYWRIVDGEDFAKSFTWQFEVV